MEPEVCTETQSGLDGQIIRCRTKIDGEWGAWIEEENQKKWRGSWGQPTIDDNPKPSKWDNREYDGRK